jgi:DNA-directed RNA polymerase specialized sigma24 family protein
MPSTLTTQILIERAQGGDRAALNDLCARYQDRVLAAVRLRMGAKLRRKVESWDIVQEVLMGAFRHIKSGDFGTEGALMKYLNVLVENRLRDEADRQNAQRRNADREISLGARSSSDGNPLIDLPDRSAPGPSTLLSRMEDLERMERAMDGLSQSIVSW